MKYLLGNDPQQEARLQNILLDRLERSTASRFASEIARATSDMLTEYERTGNAPALPLDHVRRIEALFVDLAAVSVDVFGGRILDQGKAAGLVLETKGVWSELFQRLALEYIQLEAIRQRITSISNQTRALIVSAIERGQRDGLTLPEIAAGIRENAGNIGTYRSHVIARTETHGAANYGANEAAKATGLQLKKRWVSVNDHRTRDSGQSDGVVDEYDHRAMNGQIVEMDQPFLMPHKSGTPLRIMVPGEAGAPAAAIINCRCSVVHIVDDPLFAD